MRIAILDPCSEARTQLKDLLLKIENPGFFKPGHFIVCC